jgi:UDP-N-acetylmuramoylalanine--D-glutamate ligase
MDLTNKHILVVGLGKSGISTARFLVNRGCRVTVTDNRSEDELRDVLPGIRKMGVGVELGHHKDETFERADLIVLSPGVPHTIEPLRRAREKNIPVIGEIEMAYHFIDIPIIAITGTNGKSTTTLLLGEMLEQSGFTAILGGNLGPPMIAYANKHDTADFMVAEISSFQLDTIERFKPKVSIILNITDDHLDRYPDFDAYAQSKARIFNNQDATDICILNDKDPIVRSVSKKLAARRFVFNCSQSIENRARVPGENRAWVTDQTIWFHTKDAGDQKIDCTDIPLTGQYNLENASAAGLAVLALGGKISGIEAALKKFKGLSHRVEFVDTIDGVKYYDDSKATNVDAVLRALESFFSPVVLIMGGRDKGGSYESLRSQVGQKVKQLILLGEAAEKINETIGDLVPTEMVSTMTQAVNMADKSTVSGDTVLLSPACSSFDMYESYAQRGSDFKQAVYHLKGRP